MSAETLCFQCGQPAGDPTRLNHMPNGSVCPTCRDRLLDSLPAPFPTPVTRDVDAREHRVSPSEPAARTRPEPEEVEELREAPPSTRLRALGQGPSNPFRDDDYKPSA